jgi:predicted  nucleic acid-binding Zn-ribbon protein
MSRKRSDATELRAVKRELNAAKRTWGARAEEMTHWKNRAVKAERELAEWQRRFDALLARDSAKGK